jgi:hypothetical protein
LHGLQTTVFWLWLERMAVWLFTHARDRFAGACGLIASS